MLSLFSPKTDNDFSNRVLEVSSQRAMRLGLLCGTAALAGVMVAVKRYPSGVFALRTNMQSRTAIVIMSAMGPWAACYELTMHNARAYPERYGIPVPAIMQDPNQHVQLSQALPARVRAPLHHRLMNWAYDNPLLVVAFLGIPAVVKIIVDQAAKPNMSISSRFMMSRVFGQASVLSIVFITFGLRSYMEHRGRFPDYLEA